VNRDEEFENEAHMTGIVMSSFRYAILNAYTSSITANQKNLDVRSESEVTYGEGSEEYNKYQESAISNDKEMDNLIDVVREYAETNLPYLQRRALLECVIGALDENEKKYGKKETNGEYISPSRSKLQIEIQLEPVRRNEERERDYSKAMSFIHTPPKV